MTRAFVLAICIALSGALAEITTDAAAGVGAFALFARLAFGVLAIVALAKLARKARVPSMVAGTLGFVAIIGFAWFNLRFGSPQLYRELGG
jgi:hypothetical protein